MYFWPPANTNVWNVINFAKKILKIIVCKKERGKKIFDFDRLKILKLKLTCTDSESAHKYLRNAVTPVEKRIKDGTLIHLFFRVSNSGRKSSYSRTPVPGKEETLINI